MILYSVRLKIESDAEEEWLNWMDATHIPDVVNTGFFFNGEIYKVLTKEEDGKMISYEVQFKTDQLEKLVEYSEKEAPRLQKDHSDKFGGKYTAERVVLIGL